LNTNRDRQTNTIPPQRQTNKYNTTTETDKQLHYNHRDRETITIFLVIKLSMYRAQTDRQHSLKLFHGTLKSSPYQCSLFTLRAHPRLEWATFKCTTIYQNPNTC